MVVRVIAAPSPAVEVPLPRNRPPNLADTPSAPMRREVSKELAELEVRGSSYSNWTSIRVEQRWTEAFPVFQFECTEEVPVPLSIKGAQFVPGDPVRVFLGGHQVLFGYIQERHVGFDANNHGVRLVGVGDTADLVQSKVPLDKLGGHDGKSVQQLARALSEHLGVTIHRFGNVDDSQFENIQVNPGDTPMDVIERYARMRNIVIGSAALGGLLLVGPHPVTTLGTLWEGVHMLRANVVIRDEMVFHRITVVAQNNGRDQSNGDPQNKIVAQTDGSSTRNRQDVIVADLADTRHGAEQRAQMEKVFTEGSYIEASITVQGWFKNNNTSEDIWKAGEYYTVDSPSLILYDEVLGCAGCVYEQSDAGTTTTLQMVRPIHMNGRVDLRAARELVLKQRAERAEIVRKRQEAAQVGGT